MIVDITEEEREFLERICKRAEIFAKMNIGQKSSDNDLVSIEYLIKKLKKED